MILPISSAPLCIHTYTNVQCYPLYHYTSIHTIHTEKDQFIHTIHTGLQGAFVHTIMQGGRNE